MSKNEYKPCDVVSNIPPTATALDYLDERSTHVDMHSRCCSLKRPATSNTSTARTREIDFLEKSATGCGARIYEIFFPSLIFDTRSAPTLSPQTRPKATEDPSSPSESSQI
ncbi:uncharacterized protein ARMOST_18863 [Armillaria ostoyae]|uniref:Uncharacterized protein n=1 Tax=Armillaria ostoyae TaxID=47428 RepID=A0A284S2Y2_ARMOS|nr:uncharacterized protein ARMOST_18863 [Armillaria ostoyae]